MAFKVRNDVEVEGLPLERVIDREEKKEFLFTPIK
jgi:hypothetical protein